MFILTVYSRFRTDSSCLLFFCRVPRTSWCLLMSSEKEEDYDCSLCHELLYDPCVPPCAHVFCKACLRRCIDKGVVGSRRCPLCRRMLHATSAEELSTCLPLAQLLEARFPEAYARRRAAAEQEAALPGLAEPSAAPQGQGDELPLFILDAMLPLQRMHLNVFEPRYRSLVRTSLAGGRRFGM
ncbi:unnamed protein product, partial [Polarella glacialis]